MYVSRSVGDENGHNLSFKVKVVVGIQTFTPDEYKPITYFKGIFLKVFSRI